MVIKLYEVNITIFVYFFSKNLYLFNIITRVLYFVKYHKFKFNNTMFIIMY